jgi:cyclic pyranopterin phosphate synthase
MPEENYDFAPASHLMQADEILAIAGKFIELGVNKIRLTGGEPLVRKDAADIILRLSKLPVKLTITTNGTRLHEFSDVLHEAGISSLNISLDTLDRARFQMLTRRDHFDLVHSNILKMVEKGFHVKVNVVAMKGVNDHEIVDFIQWTKDLPIHVRFIEFMPFTGNQWERDRVFTWQQVLEIAGQEFDIIPLSREKHETAKKYIVPGHQGTFAVISTMSAPFCSDCNRMRLTADGKMKNCLFSQAETDLLAAYRVGQELTPLILGNIADKKKALGGQFTTDLDKIEITKLENRSMISIGG